MYNISVEEAAEEAQQFFDSMPSEEDVHKWEEMTIRNHEQKMRTTTGILCLSENNDNILMWSHYADSHKGICIGFTPASPESAEFWEEAYCVKYEDEVPFPNIYTVANRFDLVEASLLTKSRLWAYEHEWRILSDPGLCLMAPWIKVSTVVFGMRIDPEKRRQIIEAIAGVSPPITRYEARERPGHYALDIVQVEPKEKAP